MAFAAGVFTLVAGNPVVTGTVISSTWANNTLSDIASGLSTCLLKDGTQVATAAVPFAQGLSVGGGSTLSVYSSGNWTPVIKFNSTTSGINVSLVGHYVRTGSQVAISWAYSFVSRGSSTGVCSIEGFPYQNNSGHAAIGMMTYNGMTSTLLYTAFGINSAATTGSIYGVNASATSGPLILTMSDFSETSSGGGTLTYIT